MTLGSLVRLAYYFVQRLLARLLLPRRGLARFRENYCRGEHLLPVSEEDRDAIEELSSCIACGACDVHFSAWDQVSHPIFPGPSALPLSYTRSLPDYDALEAYLTSLKAGDLDRLERVCPVGIRFGRLIQFVEARAEALGTATDEPTADH